MIDWPLIPFLHHHGMAILALIDVAAASAVTFHALLHKHNVRAAVGWIGMAWLSPFIGSGLYFLFGINRIARHGARLGTKSHLRVRELDEKGSEAMGFTAGNSVRLLRDAATTYAEMIACIGLARESVALSSYIFRADIIGNTFVDALGRAKDRGVQIRVLLDGIGAGYFYSGVHQQLRSRGVPCVRFLHSWFPWRMPFLNLRNHKKLLIVDGRIGFTGGRNIGAENVDSPGRPASVLDLHFRFDGPVVRQFMRSFVEDWVYATGELLSGTEWWPALTENGSVAARGISSGPDEDIENLFLAFASAINLAQERIRIVTPYFLPDDTLAVLLGIAGRRGVRVEIVVPERTDQRLMDWATTAQLSLMQSACEFFLSPSPFDHSKVMTVDGKRALIGSANWDARSLRLNFEFNVECVDAPLVREIDDLVGSLAQRSRRFHDERSVPRKLRDAATRLLLPYL